METTQIIYLELQKINNFAFATLVISIIDFEKDNESQDYHASKFTLNNKSIIYRLAKNTPKKLGQFVTIWKRNREGITEPFAHSNNFDYLLVASKKEQRFGFFIFPKLVLLQNKILSSEHIEGKRGFRVYPRWEKPTILQTQKTQEWQVKYFIELRNAVDFTILKSIIII